MRSLDDIYNGPVYTTMNDNITITGDTGTVTLTDYDNIATTYTLDTSHNITLDYDGYKLDPSITVGNEVITEEKLRKLNALSESSFSRYIFTLSLRCSLPIYVCKLYGRYFSTHNE